MATADSDGTLDGVLASINLSSYVHRILAEGFESAADLAELTNDEATALGSDLGMKRGEVRLLEKATSATTVTVNVNTRCRSIIMSPPHPTSPHPTLMSKTAARTSDGSLLAVARQDA